LLGEPKAQIKPADPDAIQRIDEKDAEAVGNDKPYTEEHGQVAQIFFQ